MLLSGTVRGERGEAGKAREEEKARESLLKRVYDTEKETDLAEFKFHAKHVLDLQSKLQSGH